MTSCHPNIPLNGREFNSLHVQEVFEYHLQPKAPWRARVVCLIALALLNPEPISKLGLLAGGGVMTFLLGGISALIILGKRMKAPNVTFTDAGEFKIEWE